MATVLDVVTDALTELGVLTAGETPSGADGALGLRVLNRQMDRYKAEGLLTYALTRTLHTISQVTSYTIGSGATIDTPRPIRIQSVGLVNNNVSPAFELPLRELTDAEYADWSIKGLTSPQPTAWYYNPTFSGAGFGALFLLPIPTDSGFQMAIYHPEQVGEFAALSDTVLLPPGWQEMLVTNLAMALAPSFERQADPLLAQRAAYAMSVVKRSNLRMTDLTFDPAALPGWGRGIYSIYSDTP